MKRLRVCYFKFSIGWFSKPNETINDDRLDLMEQYLTDQFETYSIHEDFEKVNHTHIKEVLEHLTKLPHIAGGPRDVDLVDYVMKKFQSFGLDFVEVKIFKSAIFFVPDNRIKNSI